MPNEDELLAEAREMLWRVHNALDRLPDDALGRDLNTGHPYLHELEYKTRDLATRLEAVTEGEGDGG